jgi:tRNA pseudouridine38-40 synthase
MRTAARVEYDGSRFHGWQAQQEGVRTIQRCVELALSRVADHPVKVIAAGRTDTGVHASAQVLHFDSSARRPMKAWVFGGNVNLPHDISILWAHPVEEGFHARFSAFARHYRYTICNRPIRPALDRHRVSWACRPLDASRMAAAAVHLIGEHDFSSYRALGCQAKTPVRRVHRLEVRRQGELIHIDIRANAFLHHMVRNIAGVLITIGSGEQEPSWARRVLEYRDRTRGGITAPPHGLHLVGVDYPTEFDLPETKEL